MWIDCFVLHRVAPRWKRKAHHGGLWRNKNTDVNWTGWTRKVHCTRKLTTESAPTPKSKTWPANLVANVRIR